MNLVKLTFTPVKYFLLLAANDFFNSTPTDEVLSSANRSSLYFLTGRKDWSLLWIHKIHSEIHCHNSLSYITHPVLWLDNYIVMLRCYPRHELTAPGEKLNSLQIQVCLLTKGHHIHNLVTGFWWGSWTHPRKTNKQTTTKQNQTQKTTTHTNLHCDSIQPSPPLHNPTGYHKRTRKWKRSGDTSFPEKLLPHTWLSDSVKAEKLPWLGPGPGNAQPSPSDF